MDLQLTTRHLDGATVVGVAGEIDNYTAPELRDALIAAFEAGARVVVVDLSDTAFLDSSALGALVGIEKRQQGTGSELRVACPTPRLRKLFDISRLDEVIRVADSVAEAIRG
jgi:anti-sigma B factor antagonist